MNKKKKKKQETRENDFQNNNKESYLLYLKSLYKNNELTHRYKPGYIPERRIKDEIAEKERIKNEGRRQDIKLKKYTLWILFGFLAVETLLIFVFSFFQAVRWPGCFHLEEWSFKLLIGATITQITTMLIIAVKHLFPRQN